MTLSEILRKHPRRKYRLPDFSDASFIYVKNGLVVWDEGDEFLPTIYALTRGDWELVPETERYEFEGVEVRTAQMAQQSILFSANYDVLPLDDLPKGGPPWKVTFERKR